MSNSLSELHDEFRAAVDLIIELEGGDKLIEDTGGLTKWGISQRAYPDLDIASLTRSDAEDLYYRDYWKAAQADAFEYPVNLFLFDAAVNQGVNAATRMLQQAAGGLAVDGIIGPKTRKRVNSIAPWEMQALFMAQRALRYTGTRAFDKYGRGWLARLFRLAGSVYQ